MNRSLFLFIIPIFLLFFSQNTFADDYSSFLNDKLKSFDILTETEKSAEIYKECLNIQSIVNKGTIQLYGTEYIPNDIATIWLQLLDNNKQSLNNGICFLTLYYPNKTIWLQNTPMSYLNSSDGIYYYDLVTPSIIGVYISSATCYVPTNAFTDDFSDYSKLEIYSNITIQNGKVSLSNIPIGLSNLTSNMTGNVLLYHLDELSGMIIDYSGSGNNGTNYEASYGVEGKINTALWFNGVNSVVVAVESNSWKPTDRVTVEAWVKFDEIKDNIGTIVGGYSSTYGYFLAVNTYSNTVYFYLNGVYYYYAEYNLGFSTDTWYHIAGTYDRYGGANNHKIYVNGQIIAQRTSSGAIGNYNQLRIGSCYSVYRFGEGTIDEVAIFNRSLSISEISNHYNSGVGIPTTTGYIQSNPISLDGISWDIFNSLYDNKSGAIDFKILNSTDNVICSGLGDISSCANTINSIKLYANITRPTVNDTSPEIDNWLVSWLSGNIEEFRGSGEIHISNGTNGGSCDLTTTNNLIDLWGNALETKLDNLILGNVTLNVTASVDYDKIATYTLMYLKGSKFWCWFMDCD